MLMTETIITFPGQKKLARLSSLPGYLTEYDLKKNNENLRIYHWGLQTHQQA